MQELSLALFDVSQHAVAAVDLLLRGGLALLKVFRDRMADLLTFGLAERDTFVVVLDRGFYEVNRLVALRTLAALVLRADEVLVEPAVAFVAGVDKLATARAAADRALEKVLVLAVALTGMPVGGEHRLHFVEQLLADQPLMPALIDVAFV